MFSIIIPLYNKAHTIERTLKSVFAQTYQRFEVIIINDGSTDGSEGIVQKIEDQRLRLISQENLGVSAARNEGIKESKFEWISFLDGDDEWMPNYLENVNLAIQKLKGVDLILSGRFSQDFFSKKRVDETPKDYLGKITQIDFFKNPHVFAHISAATVKKEILTSNFSQWGSFIVGQKYNEDFIFLFRLALHVKVGFIGKPLSIYNGGVEGQATSGLGKKMKLEDSIKFHNLVFNEWKNTKFKNENFGIFMRYEIRHIVFQFLKTDDFDSLNYFLKGIISLNTKFLSLTEQKLYLIKKCRCLNIFFILISKVRWRLRGYPVVGN